MNLRSCVKTVLNLTVTRNSARNCEKKGTLQKIVTPNFACFCPKKRLLQSMVTICPLIFIQGFTRFYEKKVFWNRNPKNGLKRAEYQKNRFFGLRLKKVSLALKVSVYSVISAAWIVGIKQSDGCVFWMNDALIGKAFLADHNHCCKILGKGSVVPRGGYLGIQRAMLVTILTCCCANLLWQSAKIAPYGKSEFLPGGFLI